MDFWQIYRIVANRKWIVIAITLVATLSTAIGFNLMVKDYRGTAVLLPTDQALQSPASMETAAPTPDPAARAKRLGSLMALAKSETVIKHALDAMGWHDESTTKIADDISVDPVAAAEGKQPTEMIQIQGYARKPKDAVLFTNALAKSFVDYYQEVTHQEAAHNRQFLEEQLITARKRLTSSENALVQFKSSRKVVSLPDEMTSALGALAPLRSTRDNTQAQLSETQAKLAAYRGQLRRISPVRMVHDDSDNPVVRELEGQLAKLESQQVMEAAVHTSKHSNMRLLVAQIANVKAKLNDEVQKGSTRTKAVGNPVYETLTAQIGDLEAESGALAARLSQLNKILGQRKAEVSNYAGMDQRLAGLSRDYQLAEDNYKAIVTRVNQARLTEKISNDSGAVTIVDLAAAPEGPIRRGLGGGQMVIAAFLLSLLAGIGVVVGLEAIDKTIQTQGDLEELIGLPVTGMIPSFNNNDGMKELPRITHLEPSSAHAEAYRFLGTDFLLSTGDSDVKTVMVATAKPGQGGTTTISNLAITIAQAGKRVILIDADMRRPMLHGIFSVDNSEGLSSVLEGKLPLMKAIRPTSVENLLLIPGGPVPENPWKLLRSKRMKEMISALKEECDYIFFDTPSAVVFADAAVIASQVDGVVMVVRAQQAPRGNELQVRNLLNKSQANIIGLVLNDAAPESVDCYHFHGRYYPSAENLGKLGNGKDTKEPSIISISGLE